VVQRVGGGLEPSGQIGVHVYAGFALISSAAGGSGPLDSYAPVFQYTSHSLTLVSRLHSSMLNHAHAFEQ